MPHLAHLVLISFPAIWCWALAPQSRAEDVVHVAVGDNVRSRTKLTGEVLDYTGETLLMRLPGGNERAFPADRNRHHRARKEHEASNGQENDFFVCVSHDLPPDEMELQAAVDQSLLAQ